MGSHFLHLTGTPAVLAEQDRYYARHHDASADVEPDVFVTTGLYELIRGAGYRIRVADQNIGATNAPADIAALLHEKKGAALITMRRVAYDDEGAAVEYGTHVYRSSRYSFSLTLVER